MDALDSVIRTLRSVDGVLDVWNLGAGDRAEIPRLEEQANRTTPLPGLMIVNDGAKIALQRDHVVCISHSPSLRHPPKPILVLLADNEVVGEEVWQEDELSKLRNNPNAILLGSGFVLFRDKLTKKKGPLTFTYGPQGFPEIEGIQGVSDVVSATVSLATDLYIKNKAGWNLADPTIGTVLVGFNSKK